MAEPSVAYNRRAVLSWAFYDFANSSFTTLVVTFIYATYFTKGIATNENLGTEQWSIAVTITAVIVAVLSPYMGALADRGGLRRRFLLATTVVGVLGSIVLFFPQQGHVGRGRRYHGPGAVVQHVARCGQGALRLQPVRGQGGAARQPRPSGIELVAAAFVWILGIYCACYFSVSDKPAMTG